jgi:hypothetical protein
MVDERALRDMSEILDGIAKTLDNFARMASKTEGAGHEDALTRINGSLADIAEVVKGLGSPGDHSATYERVESSLRDMASAVKDLAGPAAKQ